MIRRDIVGPALDLRGRKLVGGVVGLGNVSDAFRSVICYYIASYRRAGRSVFGDAGCLELALARPLTRPSGTLSPWGRGERRPGRSWRVGASGPDQRALPFRHLHRSAARRHHLRHICR
jgi:hypothetical protein